MEVKCPPPPPPPPPPITLIELINSKIFMNLALCHAGSRIHKISSTLSKVIGDGGGGGRHSASAFYSVNCVP